MKGKLPLQKFHYRPIRNFRPTESSPLLAEPCAGCYLQSRSRLQHTHCKNELPGCKGCSRHGLHREQDWNPGSLSSFSLSKHNPALTSSNLAGWVGGSRIQPRSSSGEKGMFQPHYKLHRYNRDQPENDGATESGAEC